MPWFDHRLPLYHDWHDPRSHSKPGLLHMAIDLIFYRIQRQILRDLIGDACPAYNVLKAALGFLWGLNCGFPARDVALYSVWYLRGCKALKVWTRDELLETLMAIEKRQYDALAVERAMLARGVPGYFGKFLVGSWRQSRLIMDNLGLVLDVRIGQLIYCAYYRMDPSQLTEGDRRLSYAQQCLRHVKDAAG